MTATTPDPMQLAQEQINGVMNTFQPEIDQVQAEARQLEQEGQEKFKLDMKVSWGEQKVSFDVPRITMRQQVMSLDVPQVTMNARSIVFHTPSVRMVPRVIGKKPEFHGLKVKWTDIIIDLPEVFMERQEITLDIPEFRMETTSITLDIPELVMERAEWILRVPEFRLGDVSIVVPVDNDDLERRGSDLKARGASIGQRMQTQVNAIRDKMMQEAITAGVQQFEQVKVAEAKESSDTVNQAFDVALHNIDGVLTQLGAKDPELTASLQKERSKLIDARTAALQQLEQARSESTDRMVGNVGTTLQPAYA